MTSDPAALLNIDYMSAGNALVVELLRAGASCNARDDFGRTPLHHAVKSQRVDIASTLLASGADVDAEDFEGCTPLLLCCHTGNIRLVELLIRSGAEVSSLQPL